MVSRRELAALLLAYPLHGQEAKPNMFANAKSYERFMGRWSRLIAPALVDFAEIPDAACVIDIGSGTGSLASAIARKHQRARVTGIDPSKEYIDYASSMNPYPGRVEFQIGDAQDLKLPSARFDAALSLLVFNFIPDAGKALSELRRVTKPGGRITAATWDYGAGMRMLRDFWDAAVLLDPAAENRDEKHMSLCRAGELERLWLSAGLLDVREQPLEISMRFENFADFWDPFLLGQGPAGAYVQSIGADQRQALRGELKQRLSSTSDDLPIALAARAWAVRGTVPPGG